MKSNLYSVIIMKKLIKHTKAKLDNITNAIKRIYNNTRLPRVI